MYFAFSKISGKARCFSKELHVNTVSFCNNKQFRILFVSNVFVSQGKYRFGQGYLRFILVRGISRVPQNILVNSVLRLYGFGQTCHDWHLFKVQWVLISLGSDPFKTVIFNGLQIGLYLQGQNPDLEGPHIDPQGALNLGPPNSQIARK